MPFPHFVSAYAATCDFTGRSLAQARWLLSLQRHGGGHGSRRGLDIHFVEMYEFDPGHIQRVDQRERPFVNVPKIEHTGQKSIQRPYSVNEVMLRKFSKYWIGSFLLWFHITRSVIWVITASNFSCSAFCPRVITCSLVARVFKKYFQAVYESGLFYNFSFTMWRSSKFLPTSLSGQWIHFSEPITKLPLYNIPTKGADSLDAHHVGKK